MKNVFVLLESGQVSPVRVMDDSKKVLDDPTLAYAYYFHTVKKGVFAHREIVIEWNAEPGITRRLVAYNLE